MADNTSAVSTNTKDAANEPEGTLVSAIVGSPVLWGAAGTWAFYETIPHAPMGRERLERYFCSHPLEYALVGLFCIGLAILIKRLVALQQQRSALATDLLPQVPDADPLEARLAAVDDRLQQTSSLRGTWMHLRVRETTAYLRGARSGAGLEAHLKHLAESAADRLHESYSLLLTINWAVPIIGFLGTVIGITLAIANVTPEQLDTSLNSVTGGLAVAFDTTTVAMSFSLVLVFAYDWIRRLEQRILTAVDDVALSRVLPFFAVTEAADPLARAQSEAARQLIEKTESLVEQQTRLWTDSVDGLRERWNQTLVDQQQQLTAGLTSGVEATLGDHSELLQQMRQEFLTAFESVSTQLTQALEQDRQSRDERDAATRESLQQLWSGIHDDLQSVVRSHDAHTENVIDGLTEKLEQWQSGLQHSTQTVETQLSQLQQLTDSMLQLADQEQQLVRVERRLADNLEAVQAAETFEQTLHNLTAAVHLLTARAKPRAA